MNIFIYRPDRAFDPRINPDNCYTLDGQPYHEWLSRKQTIEDYKIELAKKKPAPTHQVPDYWR